MKHPPAFKRPGAGALIDKLCRSAGVPAFAMVEIADRCNEVCVHCYQVQGQKGELDTVQWKRIFDELAELGVLMLTISGGEATLRHDFLELVGHARKLRFAVKIYTNGLTMTKALARSLAELCVQEVHVSLYSPKAETHDWVTGVTGSYERTVQGIRNLVDAGVPVVMKTPLTSFNASDFEAYADLALALGVHYSAGPTINSREDGERDPERFRAAADELVRIKRLRGTSPPREMPLSARPCGACSGALHVEPHGEMRPCNLLGVRTGHALEEGVGAAWRNDPTAKGIRELTWGRIHGCRDCDLRRHCSRCFADSLRQAGDALAPYENACRQALTSYEASLGRPFSIVAGPRADSHIGPFRELAHGKLSAELDVVTDDDRALAQKLGWVRSGQKSVPNAAPTGQLVQIRRPGRSSRLELIAPAYEERKQPELDHVAHRNLDP